MSLEVDSCCKSSAEKDHESTSYSVNFFLVHMAPKGSIIHYKLNSNRVSILILRDNYFVS